MDKKSIGGIVVVALLFVGFAYLNTREQKEYQEKMAVWQAYQDSVKMAEQVELQEAEAAQQRVENGDSVALSAAEAAR